MTIYTSPEMFEDSTPSAGQRIGGAFAGGVGSGLEMLIGSKIQNLRSQHQKKALLSKGFPPEIADIWEELTDGGKTQFASMFMDQLQREPEVQGEIEMGEESVGPSRTEGLTPKESVARQDKRYDKNLPLFQEHEKKKRGQELENVKIDQLQRLNESGALPEGLGRINVHPKTGELVIPAAASGETQLFVKTINDFLVGAKDTFGARVTNFEVDRFMKRLPSLANTSDGRTLILRQMEIINELNQLHDNGVLNAFENAGGIRNVDYDKAVREGRKSSHKREKELKSEFASLVSEGPQKPQAEEVIEKTEVIMIDSEGRRRAVSKKDVKSAKAAGYKLSQ